MDCGLVYAQEDRFNPEKEDSFETYEDFAHDQDYNEFEDEETNKPESAGRKDSSELGSLSDYTSSIEARLAQHKAAWMAEIENVPLDEAITKQRLADEKARHARAKKAFAKMGGYKVYMNKWSSMQASARKAKMLFFIKHYDMNTGTLAEIMNIGSKQFYKLLDELEQSGRIAMIKVKGVRSISLKYIPRANYVPRVPKFKPHPVLPQVKYGGIQGTTINARRH
jgi:Mor family transcriptional regulator